MRFGTAAIALLGALTLVASTIAWAAPEVGALAPDFSFEGEGGATYRLADYTKPEGTKQGRGVVIAWFPKAFTPG